MRTWLANRLISLSTWCLVLAGKLLSARVPPPQLVAPSGPAPSVYHPSVFDRAMAAAAEESGFSIVTVGHLGCAVLQPRDDQQKPHA